MHLAFRIVELEGEQALELRIPILLDDEDSLVLLEESLHLLRERERANAAVVDLDSVPRQAIDCLVDCGITTADGDDSPLGGLARAGGGGWGGGGAVRRSPISSASDPRLAGTRRRPPYSCRTGHARSRGRNK